MSHFPWITRLWQPAKNPPRKQKGASPRGRQLRPRLEALEDRTLLSAPVSTPGDLINAIVSANTAGGSTTITLAAGTTFDFTSANNSTNGSNALPVITANITIVGNGDIIERSGSNVFRLLDVASGGDLTLQSLTLSGGLAKGTGAAAEGGAIYSSGTLTLTGVTVKSNKAQGSSGTAGSPGANAYGGGLYVAGGSVSLSNDTLSGNSALGGKGGFGGVVQGVNTGNGGAGGNGLGGGMYVANSVSFTSTNDTFRGNIALGGSGGTGGNGSYGGNGGAGGNGSGGGMYVSQGSVTLTSATLSGNDAGGGRGGIGGHGMLGNGGGGGGKGGNGAGGGIYVASPGSVTLTSDALSGNKAQGGAGGQGIGVGAGGGGNGSGGSMYVSQGVVTLTQDTLSNNNALGGNGGLGGSGHLIGGSGGSGGNGSGGGMFVGQGSVTLTNDTLSGNDAQGGAGGNGNHNSPPPSQSIPGGNGGTGGDGSGGGMYVSQAFVTLTNDTLSGNNAQGGLGRTGSNRGGGIGGKGRSGGNGSGGGMYVSQGTVTLTNDTLSSNNAQGGSGGSGGSSIFGLGGAGGSGGNGTGGGLFVLSGSTINLTNTLIAENNITAGNGGAGGTGRFANGPPGASGSASGPDVAGNVTSSDHDLIGDGTGSNLSNGTNSDLVGSSASPLNPLLAPLGSYGGPTQTMALLPGSPAIDAGDSAQGGTTDQRGKPRVGVTDIGAFESQGFTLAITGGNNQTAAVNTAFAQPLAVSVTANNAGEPVTGGQVTFMTPNSGASAILSPASSVAIDDVGNTSVNATANNVGGSYSVTANTAGALASALFHLTNQSAPTLSVTDAGGTYNGTPFPATGSAVGVDGTTPVAGSFSYTYYSGNSPSGTPVPDAPANAGTYTVVAAFTSSDSNYTDGSAQTTFTIVKAAAAFLNLSVNQITMGTSSTTVSGQLLSNTIAIPVGQSVSISLQDMTLVAAVATNGTFSVSFPTATLVAGTYPITYSYPGDNNYSAASAQGGLTVSSPISPSPPPASTSTPATFPQSILDSLVTNIQAVPFFQTAEAKASLEGLFALTFSLASAQSPQQAIDLVLSELGLTWDLLLAGGNIQVLMSNPQAVALANAIEQNPLYQTQAGWLMANAEMEWLLIA